MRITPALRAALFAVWKGKCAYCDGPAEHVDHVIPRAKGGMNHLENYVPACGSCNIKKSDFMLDGPYVGILIQQAKSRAKRVSDVMAAKLASGSKRRVIRAMREGITTIALDLPMRAVGWVSRQPEADHLVCQGNAEIIAAFTTARPRWEGPIVGGPLVLSMSSAAKPFISVHPDFVRACKISAVLGSPSFEFKGVEIPASHGECTPVYDERMIK